MHENYRQCVSLSQTYQDLYIEKEIMCLKYVSNVENLSFAHNRCSNSHLFPNWINTTFMSGKTFFGFASNMKRPSKRNSLISWRVYQLNSHEWTVQSNNIMYHISFYIKRKQNSKSISKKTCIVQKTKRETKSQEDYVSFLFLFFCLTGDIGKVTVTFLVLPCHLDHKLVGMGYAFSWWLCNA